MGLQILFKIFVIYNRSLLDMNVISFLWLMLNSIANSPENVYATTFIRAFFCLGHEVKRCRVKIRLDLVLAAKIGPVQRRPYCESKEIGLSLFTATSVGLIVRLNKILHLFSAGLAYSCLFSVSKV